MTTNDHGSSLPPLAGRPSTRGPAPSLAAPVADAPAARAVEVVRDAPWWWIGFATLLGTTALLYLWGLGASGWANDFYSAAAQAGSQSWKAFFFGSSDAANAITVDKPPASLWLMGLSVRVFGLSSWSILIPQALLGVGSVAMLALTVRRWFGSGAALLSGAVLALTPVAVLMFRFNNPDALLVFLLVVGAYAMTRAVERASMWWVVAAGSAVGFAFLTKMLQALLVLPAFALVYLIAAPTTLRRRIGHVLAGGAAMVVSAGWWVAIVELWPASSRPYIGGSQNNSVLELIFGYNGFGRLTGNQVGSVGGGGGGGGGRWGETGWDRMFQASWSGQIAWLIPAALLAIVAAFVLTRRVGRTDRLRAATILWGGWFVVTMLTFSFGQGIIHEYYSVALAPAIGALVGIVGRELWNRRDDIIARVTLAGGVLVTAFMARSILGNASDWKPWLSSLVVAVGIGAAVLLVAGDRWHARARLAAVGTAVVALLLAPSAYALQTASTAHSGAIPTAGPQVDRGFGGMGGRGGPRTGQGGPPTGFGNSTGAQGNQSNGMSPFGGSSNGIPGASSNGTQNGATVPGGAGQDPFSAAQGGFGPPGASSTQGQSGSGSRWGQRGSASNAGPGAGGGGAGGLLRAGTPSTEVVSALTRNADDYTWVAATVGSNSAAGFQLASQQPVMAIGGFNGSDPSPTLDEFVALVQQGKIHWFIGGGRMGGNQMGGSRASSEIAAWVAENFEAQEIGNTTMYDLTQPVDGS